MARNLTIKKTREYVWRVQLGGQFADHNGIPCWWVVDQDGFVVAGGFARGCNVSSGYAQIARKKDARAFIEGYEAIMSGTIVARTCGKDGDMLDNFAMRRDNPYSWDSVRAAARAAGRRNVRVDEGLERSWYEGAQEALEEMLGVAHRGRRFTGAE